MGDANINTNTAVTKKKYNMYDDIPIYNKVLIKLPNNSKNDSEYLFLIDDGVSIKCSSKFGPLWQAQPNDLMNLLSSSFGLPSGQFALQGAQIWKSTDPLSMSLTVTRYMDDDPYTDVITPTKMLMGKCLPVLGDRSNMSTVTMTLEQIANSMLGIKLLTLIPPGPNIQDLLSAMANTNSSGEYTGLLGLLTNRADLTAKTRGWDTIKIGNFAFDGCIITSVSPTFSKTTAYSSLKKKYYPISVQLAIEFSSIQVATTGYVNGVLDASGNASIVNG